MKPYALAGSILAAAFLLLLGIRLGWLHGRDTACWSPDSEMAVAT